MTFAPMVFSQEISSSLSQSQELQEIGLNHAYLQLSYDSIKEGTLLFTQYSLLKDDLPDGTDFEDFLEKFKFFLQ